MNDLSVWTFSYSTRYYLTHPWKFVKEIYWNIRNFIHRGRYGFAYVDVWNFCEWYPRVAANALCYLAEHGSGYPGYEPWETTEKWKQYLYELACKLEHCANAQDICFHEGANEFEDAFHSMMEIAREKNIDINEIPEYTSIKEKYFAREHELSEIDGKFIENTYKELGANLSRLWD